jgi:hypothetical protein
MRAKRVLTILLGAFVIVAIVTVAKQAIHSAPRNPVVASAVPLAHSARPAPIQTQVAPAAVVSDPPAAAVPPVPNARVAPANEASLDAVAKPKASPAARRAEAPQRATPPSHVRKVVATYFHGNVRCVTCRKIEAQAQEAVHDGFEEQIAAGTVVFRAVNVEEDANRHFIQDYQLVTRTLVVTEEVDGSVTRWAKLDNVWTLVNDRTAFFRYVQGGVRDYLVTQ